MGVSTIPASGGGGLRPKYQKFTSSGTFTLPDGYGAANPLLITMQVIGGGGGGAGNQTLTTNQQIYLGRNNYFGQGAINISASYAANQTGRPGASGGLAATQLYLTANLTITVGAAGTQGTSKTWTYNTAHNNGNAWNGGNYANTVNASTNATPAGGDGGTTTAGSVSATGGKGGIQQYTANDLRPHYWNQSDFWNSPANSQTATANTFGYGAAGNPAGTVGDAVPLLGTLAGGSTNTTPVYGSFGIGGKSGDGATTTGVEGTGGGLASIGAPGAVIITYWA